MKKAMVFAQIFLLLLAAYVAFHCAAYFSALYFFEITTATAKLVLLLVTIFLASSFFVATWLSHTHDNLFTRGFYFFAGSWIGLLVNLVLFFALAWIVVAVFSWLGKAAPLQMLGIVVLVLSLAYSAYGIWNAFTPQVTDINIKIKNLPAQWVGKKIVQISDVHLGHIYRAQYMQMVAEKINALHPDIILITGDLFDGTDGNLNTFVKPLNVLSAPDGIFFVTGNHETYLGTSNALNILKQTNIMVLQDDMRNLDGLQIIGIDYPERGQTKDVAKTIGQMPGFDKNEPSILMWHMPTQIAQIKNAGISLMLSGHTHKGQLFPLGIFTKLIFQGYDYGLKQDGDFSEYTSSGLGGWGPPMRTEKNSEIVQITLQ